MKIKDVLLNEIKKRKLLYYEAGAMVGIPKVRFNNIMSGRNSCLSIIELVKIHTVLRASKFCELLAANNWDNYQRHHKVKPKACVMCGEVIVNKDDHLDCYIQIMQDRSETMCVDIANQLSSRQLGIICHRLAVKLIASETEAYKLETLVKRKIG